MRLACLLLAACLPVAAACAEESTGSAPVTGTELESPPGVLGKQPAAPESTPSSVAPPAAPATGEGVVPGDGTSAEPASGLFGNRYSGALPPRPEIKTEVVADDGRKGGLITREAPVASREALEDPPAGIVFSTGFVNRDAKAVASGLSAFRNGQLVTAVKQDVSLAPALMVGVAVRQRLRDHLDIYSGLDFLEAKGGDVASADTLGTGVVSPWSYDVRRYRDFGVAIGGTWKRPVKGCFTAEAGLALRQAWISSRLGYMDAFGTPVTIAVSDSETGLGGRVGVICRVDAFLAIGVDYSATDVAGTDSRDTSLYLRWHLR